MYKSIKNISILMPAYNSGKFIEQSIKSILNQTFKEFEFIIINDGSTDNTEEIINKFKDSRIVYKKTVNRGTSAALNLGLDIASSDWIARIDSDDLNTKDRLETQIVFLNDNPDYDIISCWSAYFEKNKIKFLLQEPTEHSRIYRMLSLHNPLNQSGVIYKKEIIKNERYNEKILYNEDFELFHRIKDKVRFYNLPEFLVHTRIRKDSKSNLQNNKNIYDFIIRDANHNLMNATSKGQHFYWTNIIAWINFFYGERNESRNYFLHSPKIKNIISYICTFLPEKSFYKFINWRPKYRIRAIFTNKSVYNRELRNLLTN
jgi:glycosyltransferase involved in cell wall biosynthesis